MPVAKEGGDGAQVVLVWQRSQCGAELGNARRRQGTAGDAHERLLWLVGRKRPLRVAARRVKP